MINAPLWTELFISNKEKLVQHIDNFQKMMTSFRTAIQNEDGTSYTLLNEYQGDRLVKQERYNPDAAMVSRTSFEYDEQGRVKRATFLTPGAASTVTAVYVYGPVYIPDADE